MQWPRPSSRFQAGPASRNHGKETAMLRRGIGTGRLLALIAAVIFVLAAIGSWPDSLQDDVEPIALGLAFLAASFVLP
jgi:hypothetical protein